MSFKEVRLNPNFSYGTGTGPEYRTIITELPSGMEVRRSQWSKGRRKISIKKELLDADDVRELESFFRAMRGRAYGFRVRDWAWYLVEDETLPLLTNTTAQLQFKYLEPVTSTQEIQIVTKPVLAANVVSDPGLPFYSPDISLKRNGSAYSSSNYTLDRTTGIITFGSSQAGNTFTWSGSYDWPMRFDSDVAQFVDNEFNSYDWSEIALVEIKA